MIIRACDLAVIPSAAEATLFMDAICQATKLTQLAAVVPEIWHRPVSKDAPADVHPDVRLRARHRLEGRLATEPALVVHAVGLATQHSSCASGVIEVRHCGNVRESAHLRAWAMDVLELTLATMAALHMLAIGIAAMHAQHTTRLPICWDRRRRREGARGRWGRSCAFRTPNVCVGEVAAETTLGVHAICVAADPSHLALGVPIVRDVRRLWKLAAAGRTWHRNEIAAATKTTLHMFPIGIATEPSHVACRVPEEADTHWRVVELARTTRLGTVLGMREIKQQDEGA